MRTRCHLLLMTLATFGAPPDFFSLPDSALTQVVHASVFRLLSPQSPFSLAIFSVWTSIALSSWVHVETALSLVLAVLVLSFIVKVCVEYCKRMEHMHCKKCRVG